MEIQKRQNDTEWPPQWSPDWPCSEDAFLEVERFGMENTLKYYRMERACLFEHEIHEIRWEIKKIEIALGRLDVADVGQDDERRMRLNELLVSKREMKRQLQDSETDERCPGVLDNFLAEIGEYKGKIAQIDEEIRRIRARL